MQKFEKKQEVKYKRKTDFTYKTKLKDTIRGKDPSGFKEDIKEILLTLNHY